MLSVQAQTSIPSLSQQNKPMLSYLCEIEYAHIHVNAFGGQKGMLGPLELTSSSESSNMGAGNQTLVPLKNSKHP